MRRRPEGKPAMLGAIATGGDGRAAESAIGVTALSGSAVCARIEVWSDVDWLKGPAASFNQDVLAASDALIKHFVNDWTKAQNSP
jgi:hypothetical protein